MFDLSADGVDDLVEEHGAIGLEGLPLKAAAEDNDGSQRAALVEAQVVCPQPDTAPHMTHSPPRDHKAQEGTVAWE